MGKSDAVTSYSAAAVRAKVPPTKVPMLRLGTRLMGLPWVGPVTAGFIRSFTRKRPFLNVRVHTNPFFFRDGELHQAKSAGGALGVLQDGFQALFRPSLNHDRGYASQITSSDDPDGAGAIDDAVPDAVRLQFMEQERLYDSAFGFERFWDGAARGLTLVGLSSVHGRGLFALQDIPKGTLVISPRRTHFFDGPTFIYLLGDDPARLAKWAHYGHHGGGFFAPPMAASPLHLLNHSCEPSLREGFRFSPARAVSEYAVEDAASTDRDGNVPPRFIEDPLDLQTGEFTVDPHALVAARDIRRGEELTIDYAARIAPMYPGELGGVLGGATLPTHRCKCGSRSCRGVLHKGAEVWRGYASDEARRAAVEDAVLRRALKDDEEFHHHEMVRASLLYNRQRLVDLMDGPLCHPQKQRNKVHNLHLAIESTIAFLNQLEAERDCRP